jgi:hypothetical protein
VAECILCGATIGRNTHSRQHVFPEWLKQYFLPDDGTETRAPHIRKLKRRGEPMSDMEWEATPFNMRIKDMCKPCNNEWCNAIENDAKPLLIPMIAGEQIWLDVEQQGVLATQAMLIALMLQLTHAERQRSIPLSAYHWFRKWRMPLANEQMWVALYDGSGEWPTSYRHYGMSIFDAAVSDPPDDVNAHALAFTIGHLVVISFGHTVDHEIRVGLKDGAPSAVIRPIWPIRPAGTGFPGNGRVEGAGGLHSLVDGFGDASAFHADGPQDKRIG